MSLRLAILRHLPDRVVRPRLVDQLTRATVEGFGTTAPDWHGASVAERLVEYAELTATEAGRVASDAPPALYRNALALGSAVRRRLGIRRPQEALEALVLLYRHLGIEIAGRVSGDTSGDAPSAHLVDVEVTRCFFADYYCEAVCRVMSALDAGVVDGLFGGASLEFSQRITDGSPCCRAVIRSAALT